MGTQLSFIESMLDLLYLEPLFIIGAVIVAAGLYWLFRTYNYLPKCKIVIGSLTMYFYLCIVFNHIVGIPTIQEFSRLASLGESFFNPNINLIPLADGVSIGFILNIICFLPLGFLSPIISRTYEQTKKVLLLGLGVSFVIEISQLFTLYRATDIDDVITNSIGTVIGFLCFKLIARSGLVKSYSKTRIYLSNEPTWFLPVLITATAFLITFIS